MGSAAPVAIRLAPWRFMPDDKTPCQQVRDLYENAIAFWKPRRLAMDRLEEFLAGDRYEDEQQHPRPPSAKVTPSASARGRETGRR